MCVQVWCLCITSFSIALVAQVGKGCTKAILSLPTPLFPWPPNLLQAIETLSPPHLLAHNPHSRASFCQESESALQESYVLAKLGIFNFCHKKMELFGSNS